MITVFIGDDGKKHKLVTQQYEIGTYCIVDSDPAQQLGVESEESQIHKTIRELYKYIEEESTKLN